MGRSEIEFSRIWNSIIDNNVDFKFPTLGRTQAYLRMKRTNGK